MYHTFIIKYLILLLFAMLIMISWQCKSTEKKNNNSKLSSWRQQQLYETYVNAMENQDYFISLGISYDADLNMAITKAKIESEMQMPEIIEVYVTTYQQYCEQSGTHDSILTNTSLIYSRSETNISGDVNHEVVSTFKNNGLFYIAVNGKIKRDKCDNPLSQFYNHSKSSRLVNFRQGVNEVLNQMTKDIYFKK